MDSPVVSHRRPSHLHLISSSASTTRKGDANRSAKPVHLQFSPAAFNRLQELSGLDGCPPNHVIGNALWLYESAWQAHRAGGSVFIEYPTVCFRLNLPLRHDQRESPQKL